MARPRSEHIVVTVKAERRSSCSPMALADVLTICWESMEQQAAERSTPVRSPSGKRPDAAWLYIQRYFAGGRVFRLARGGATINVRIPTANLLNEAAVWPRPRGPGRAAPAPRSQTPVWERACAGGLGSDLPWKRRL